MPTSGDDYSQNTRILTDQIMDVFMDWAFHAEHSLAQLRGEISRTIDKWMVIG